MGSSLRKAAGPGFDARDQAAAVPEVRISDWQLREAMEHAGIGTAFVSIEGRWLYANPALRSLLGYEAQELARLTFQDLTHPDDLDADMEQVRRVLADEINAYQMEKRYFRKDGSVLWALLSVSLVRDELRRPQFFISQVLDITQRKAAELDRQILTNRLTLAAQAGGIGVWDWDLASNDLTCDERLLRLYGLPLGRKATMADLSAATHPEDTDRVSAHVATSLMSADNYEVEFRVVLPSGEVRHLRGAAGVQRDLDGAPVRVIGVTWDTTYLRRLASDAQAASEAKTRFLATMSHEIRTPLNGVLGMAQVLAADPGLTAEQRERIDVISDSGEALLTILNDILDLTKIEAGKLELEETTFDLGRVLAGVHATFSSIAAEKDIALALDLGDAAGAYRGDPTRLRQIVANLVSNALKFTQEGEVRIRAGTCARGLVIRVSDTGVGIRREALDKVFGSFTQADSSVTRLHGGTGLGLAICRELATLMGGELTVESEFGRGTTFQLEAPLPHVAEPELDARPASLAAPPDASVLRVLVAEDNATNQLVLRALLAQFEVNPKIVGDGRQALEAWRAQDWDVILMDVQMPVLDGVSAARAIRAEEAAAGRPRTPIVALTANAMTQQVDSYLEAGMDGYVPKPIDVRALLQALELGSAA